MPIKYSDYPRNWPALSSRIRRAAKRCEGCGATDKRPHPSKGFTVHLALCHRWDFAPENTAPANLAVWCQSCHRIHDNPEQGRRRRYGKRYRAQPGLFDY